MGHYPGDIKQALCELSASRRQCDGIGSCRTIAELDSLGTLLRGLSAGIHGVARRDASKGPTSYYVASLAPLSP
ncbi:hypothetical protein [Sodalis-like endosymbiont of Proechinophthirus fluctus]|uniref:hypothetical protein n=1 Tax=Sodalis-like endosymbiont of Proechinophthirus fluctus TaxID=1462730 RepID=UPI00082E20A3|nr:hypothetical protein [Sodalis-like endosymbiont of Proechinophthirus fluctus]